MILNAKIPLFNTMNIAVGKSGGCMDRRKEASLALINVTRIE